MRFDSAGASVSVTSEDLPLPETPVDHGHRPKLDLDIHVLEVVLRDADHLDRPSAGSAPLGGNRDGAPARQVRRGQGLGAVEDRLRRAETHDLAAVLACPGAHVDHEVGRADRLLVVLDDEHRVAEVAQALERADKPRVVALVQTDAGLVEDVEHAHESGADLGREADALGLAPGERRRAALEGEVVEPDVDQEAQSLPDLLDHPRGDLRVALVEARDLSKNASESFAESTVTS